MIDRWLLEHEMGEHDAWGSEVEDCPACEDRYQEEQASLREYMSQEIYKQCDEEDEKENK